MFTSLISALALGSVLVNAIEVKSPSKDTIWQSGTSGQTVSWQAVSTDPTSFVIQLVNQAGFLTNSPVTLIANQSTGTANQQNSITVSYPNGAWPIGTAFQINLMSSSNSNAAILAQSGQFNITAGGSGVAATAASPTTLTSTGSQTTQVVTSTIPAVTAGVNGGTSSSNSSGDASGGIPNAVSSTGAADIAFGTPSSFVSLLIGLAGLIGVTI